MGEALDPNLTELPSVIVGDPIFDGKVILYVIKGEFLFFLVLEPGEEDDEL